MSAQSTSVDPITFEILSHRMHQITTEMGTTLERVGGTVNTNQLKDYIAALYRPNGDVMSAGVAMAWHVACAGAAVKRIINRFGAEKDIHPGDMFMLNDPYVAAIHQSDVYVIAPLHYGEQLVGWSATFVHVMDIGAMSPGGNSPDAREVFHEGLRVPGIKLIDRGNVRRDVYETITTMTRQPDMVGLDLKSEIAANNVARARIQELYAQYGVELMVKVSDEMIAYTERILRKRLSELPDGRWTAEGTIRGDDPWTIRLALEKNGDRLHFDFTGTDPQAPIGINLPYHATVGACFESVLFTLGFDLPKNHGFFSVMDVTAPAGTLVNVKYPGPVSLNTTSGGVVCRYVTNSVLSKMVAPGELWRREVMAHNLGYRMARHAGVDQSGRYYVSTLLGLSGGGARSYADGIDSARLEMERPSSIHNVEWVESNFPLLHLFRRHVRDGSGAGKFRGGAGEETAFILHDAPEKQVRIVALGVAGLSNSGHGTDGGYPGAPSVLVHMRDTQARDIMAKGQLASDLTAFGGTSRLLPYCSVDLKERDVLYLRCGSGGGYGDPLERDPKAVQADVVNALISRTTAEAVYGVVLDTEHKIDRPATARAREKLRARRAPASPSRPRSTTDGDPAGMSRHPVQEHVEACSDGRSRWLRCTGCGHRLGAPDTDWLANCVTREFEPTTAGPLMDLLAHEFTLRQWYCPGCGVLLRTEMAAAHGGHDHGHSHCH